MEVSNKCLLTEWPVGSCRPKEGIGSFEFLFILHVLLVFYSVSRYCLIFIFIYPAWCLEIIFDVRILWLFCKIPSSF